MLTTQSASGEHHCSFQKQLMLQDSISLPLKNRFCLLRYGALVCTFEGVGYVRTHAHAPLNKLCAYL
jgi:hypothetical protein